MRKCAFCGTENLEDTLFCEWCDTRLTSEFEEGTIGLSVTTKHKAAETTNVNICTTPCDGQKEQIHAAVFAPQVGELYDGKVTRILQFGAFVELAPGKEGLVHISRLAEYRVEKVEDVVNVGDMIWVKITEIDEKGHINLSHKDALREVKIKRQNGIEVPSTYQCYKAAEPQDETCEFIPRVGGLHDGKVTRILQFGAFVELAPGKEGLVHISNLADYHIEKADDVVKVGDMIWVKITEIDEKGRINLSHKDALREIEIKRQKGESIE